VLSNSSKTNGLSDNNSKYDIEPLPISLPIVGIGSIGLLKDSKTLVFAQVVFDSLPYE
jgi:hypothetical protein